MKYKAIQGFEHQWSGDPNASFKLPGKPEGVPGRTGQMA
jgi:hypothetical protein